MATPAWLRYANQGATRNQPLNPQLVAALGFLPELGVEMEVFSGGQPSSGPNRVGSHRHDHGNAGDVFFKKDGRRLDWANPSDRPIFEQIVQRGKAAGVTGFGAGQGYMQPGSMHLGFGSPSVWGAGGSGANAPDWLRNAYSGAPAGKIGGDSMVARNFDPQVAGQTSTPMTQAESPFSFGGGLLAQPQQQGINPELAALAGEDEKSPMAKFGGLLSAIGKAIPDAPQPQLGPMPDARKTGGLLNEFLSSMKRRA